jgi:hypothetical protein
MGRARGAFVWAYIVAFVVVMRSIAAGDAPLAATSRAAAPAAAPATAPVFRACVDLSESAEARGTAWELAVPDGHYVVRIATREPAKVADLGDAQLEGVAILAGASAMNRQARSINVIAEVRDGRLTLAKADGFGTVLRSVEVDEAYAPQRIIRWTTIGNSGTVVADRLVGWDIKRTGWTGYINRMIQPGLNWGCRRIALHNPFGCLPRESMQFDQYLHATDAKLGWLTRDFVRAWRPITERGIEVICYLGTTVHDPDFEQLWKGDRAAWEARVWASVQPALDAGMTIALDASSTTHEGENRIATMLQARGVPIYCEPRPSANAPRWFAVPVITTDNFWKRSNPENHPDSAWAARNDQLTGEIIRIVHLPPAGSTWETRGWVEADTRAILADGHTAATPVDILMRDGVPLWRLLKK